MVFHWVISIVEEWSKLMSWTELCSQLCSKLRVSWELRLQMIFLGKKVVRRVSIKRYTLSPLLLVPNCWLHCNSRQLPWVMQYPTVSHSSLQTNLTSTDMLHIHLSNRTIEHRKSLIYSITSETLKESSLVVTTIHRCKETMLEEMRFHKCLTLTVTNRYRCHQFK